MTLVMRVVYAFALAAFAAIAGLALAAGTPTIALAAALFAATAPFVLGRRWRPQPPRPTRRPVYRRRR